MSSQESFTTPLKIDILEPKNEGLLQMMFLFKQDKQVIFRFQPFIFQGVWFIICQHGDLPRFVSRGGLLEISGSRWVHVSSAGLFFSPGS